MTTVTLGNTGITVNKNGFGALPIQRTERQAAVALLRRALDGGMNYFDTARMYSDSEEKLGIAFEGRRSEYILATKSEAKTGDELRRDLETSLGLLKTDYIDVYQLHNIPFVPRPGDDSGVYDALLEMKTQGKIRHIAITNHRLPVAREAVESGLYEVLQYPFSYLSTPEEQDLVRLCQERGVGFVAMKALGGGMLANSAACYAWLAQFPSVLPIWGIQREQELEEFLSYVAAPPALTPQLRAVIDADQKELLGNFCRACGYCLPCPADIEIFTCARISQLIRRSPSHRFLTPEFQAKMEKIEGCIQCRACAQRCPYDLDPPALLQKNLADYREILAGKPIG